MLHILGVFMDILDKNQHGKEIFKQLIDLTSKNNSFVFKDFDSEKNGYKYRIFHYELPKYSDFKSTPFAMKARGIMFKINQDGSFIELCSYPMDKFFSYGENPDTVDLNISDIKHCYVKEDGSLLSTYIDFEGNMQIKSMKQPKYLLSDIVFEHIHSIGLYNELNDITQNGFTVNMEFTSPLNRVLQNYNETSLHILNIRSNENGTYIDKDTIEFKNKYPNIYKNWVKEVSVDNISELFEGNRYLTDKNFEGYVVELFNGTLLKVKTEWYLSFSAIANMQDFSKYNEYLFKAVINETTDELKTLLHYKNRSDNFKLEEKLEDISKMENYVKELFHSSKSFINDFYNENKELSQKEFVLKIKDSERPDLLNILIQMKLNKNHNLKDFLIKNYAKKTKIVVNKPKNI